MKIKMKDIIPNPQQPRVVFDDEELQSLANSIAERGLLQPIIVEKYGENQYVIVDGERRFRAHKLLELQEIEAMVREATDDQSRAIDAMIANIQRADLNPIEEARSFQKMHEEFGMTFLNISRVCGVSYPLVTHRIQWLSMPTPIQELVASGKLPKSEKVFDALNQIDDLNVRIQIAMSAAKKHLSIQSILKVITRYLNIEHEKKSMSNGSPSMAQYVNKGGVTPPPQWDAMREAGLVPSWKIVRKASEITCRKCSLSYMASEEICGKCPVPEFLCQLEDIIDD